MPKIDVPAAPQGSGTRYPSPFRAPCLERRWIKLGDAAGLSQFGVNQLTLPPGAWSSQRHWHSHEDEFVMVLDGEVVLVTDAGRETLRAGDSAGFPAGAADGHHFLNLSDSAATLLVVGSRRPEDSVTYPDIDLHLPVVPKADGARSGPRRYTRKDGTPY